jgi:hypothetical protein
MRYLLIGFLLLTACAGRVESIAICSSYKAAFSCTLPGNNIYLCDTKEACNKICGAK